MLDIQCWHTKRIDLVQTGIILHNIYLVFWDEKLIFRYDVLKQGKERYDKDGLNNLKYKLLHLKRNLLYTWLLVGVEPPS